MARPRKPETLTAISVRLPEALIIEVDRCADALQADMPLLQVTRTDAIRYLIQLGLESHRSKRKGARRR